MKLREFYVYILTNQNNSVIYIGMTNDLMRRVAEHKEGAVEGFTKKYRTHKLVYYEICDTAEQAIGREKQLKNWHRDWKFNLIRSKNPNMRDLSKNFLEIPKRVRDDDPGIGGA